MAEKARKSRWSKQESSSEEESEDDSEDSPPPIENKFANDGSFLEIFKKKMAEEADGAPPEKPVPVPVPRTETEDGETQLKAYQDGVGRRKTLLKSQQLREKRKRKREEIEEQKKLEESGPQSVAWKDYMKQVKEFKEKCCSEKDDHKRPLVK